MLLEAFGIENNVYTLGEFIEEDTDIASPYGSEDELYEKFFDEVCSRVERVILRIEAKYHEEAITEGKDNVDSNGIDNNKQSEEVEE